MINIKDLKDMKENLFALYPSVGENLDYIKLNLLQAFSPDNVDEAKNRGFNPA